MDLDSSPLYIKEDKAFFLKGVVLDFSANPEQANSPEGQNAGEIKPEESNMLYCSVKLPFGRNICVGSLAFEEAGEVYVWVHNSEGNHLIYRLTAKQGGCQIVYNFCKGYDWPLDPKYFIHEGRAVIESICRVLPDGTKELYKELYWVNGYSQNHRLVIEDSIATNSFTTPFFGTPDICCGDCKDIIKSGVPTPMGCISKEDIPPTDEDKKKQNRLLNKMFQFRLKEINVWGQASEHGVISDGYFNNIGGCSKDAANLPHCWLLKFKRPCPTIAKIILEVKTCQLANIAGTDGNAISDWKEYQTIDLYDESDPTVKWYNRVLNKQSPDFSYVDNDTYIQFKFCNNKECKTIAQSDVRNLNPAPMVSKTVAKLGNQLIYGNNDYGFDNVPKADLSGFSVAVEKTADCDVKYSNIKVYAAVHNFFSRRPQNNPVYKKGGVYGFGGFGWGSAIDSGAVTYEENVFAPEGSFNAAGGYGQIFPDGVKNFRAMLCGADGSEIIVEAKQYYQSQTAFAEIGSYDISQAALENVVDGLRPNQNILVQCFDFSKVPCGKYYFRIVGHSDTGIDVPLPHTSTYYIHTTPYQGYRQYYTVVENYEKEIFIDTSNGSDYDSIAADKIAIIADLTHPQDASSIGSRVIRGYIQEDKDSKQPIDMAYVTPLVNLSGVRHSGYTDHNGFYFIARRGFPFAVPLLAASLRGYNNCSQAVLGTTQNKSSEGTSLNPVLYATSTFPNYVKDLCNRYLTTGRVLQCGTQVGVEGVSVVMGRTRGVRTNAKGEFTIISHFNPDRTGDIVVFNSVSCAVVDCSCGPINFQQFVAQPVCDNCNKIEVEIGDWYVKVISRYGPGHGSRIGWGLKGHDWLGRHTEIQAKEDWYIDIPTEQEQKNSTYSKIKVILPKTLPQSLCRQFKYLSFYFTKNLNYQDSIEWAADKIEFVDAAGNVNAASPLKVKVWYRSLAQYNLKRGNRTNSAWSIKDIDDSTLVGDEVEFIQQADGVYLPIGIGGVVQHDKDGTYFLVDYDDTMKNLKDGVRFKLKRPFTCEGTRIYYEHCSTVYLCSGDCTPKAQDGSQLTEFYVNYFDSFSLKRQIPVVTDVKTTVPATGGGTQELITQKIEIKNYPFSFEHHSPSDTWGDHCFSGGRVNIKNPYEGKRCNRSQILLTGAINYANDGLTNYLHYFSFEDGKVYDEQQFGAIQALIVKGNQILAICDTNAFSFAFDDDRAVVSNDNFIKVPANNRFSRPEKNFGVDFGCQPKDTSTIRMKDGKVVFLDSNKSELVYHDFFNAVGLAVAGAASWLSKSVKEMNLKEVDGWYWHGMFDPKDGRYLLTKQNFNKARVFVNDYPYEKTEDPSTISFDINGKMWQQFHHYVPEYYAALFSDRNDSQLFSFKEGLPYMHHTVLGNGIHLNYFGVQCRPYIGIAINKGNTNVKAYQYTEVYAKYVPFIIEDILTEMGQQSSLYEGQWEIGNGMQSAAFLCDTRFVSTQDIPVDALMDGDTLYGKWMKALYSTHRAYAGEYFILTGIINWFTLVDKSGT